MVILDGLGDRPNAILNHQTPLEAAKTPHLDRLAKEGLCGLIHPIFPGVPVGTHTGCALLMGLYPSDSGGLARGPVEAAGIGLDMHPGDLAIRCNFATLEEDQDGLKIIDRRAGRISENTELLAEELQDVSLKNGITASLRPATQHRAVLHLRGPELSDQISDTDPGTSNMHMGVQESVPLIEHSMAATTTANAINLFSHKAFKRLRQHEVNRTRIDQGLRPATGIICRGVGMMKSLRTLISHYNISSGVVTGERTVIGLSKLFGYEVDYRAPFTAMIDTNLDLKVSAVIEMLERKDLVFLHIKAPDICAHDLDPRGKRDFLERVDRALKPLLKLPISIVISGDHSTDSFSGRHSGDPVPSILNVPRGRNDHCESFGEREVMLGAINNLSATELLTMMIDAMGYVHQFQGKDSRIISNLSKQ